MMMVIFLVEGMAIVMVVVMVMVVVTATVNYRLTLLWLQPCSGRDTPLLHPTYITYRAKKGTQQTVKSCFFSLSLLDHDFLIRYREAELKHGRLAMVALAGWPIATLLLGLLTKVCAACASTRGTRGL